MTFHSFFSFLLFHAENRIMRCYVGNRKFFFFFHIEYICFVCSMQSFYYSFFAIFFCHVTARVCMQPGGRLQKSLRSIEKEIVDIGYEQVCAELTAVAACYSCLSVVETVE